MSRLQARNVSQIPGYVLMSLTAPARSVDGREWPVGTEYTPRSAGSHSSGHPNDPMVEHQTVMIRGYEVVFGWDRRGRAVAP